MRKAPEGMLRKRQVADLLGVTTRAVEKMVARGDFPRPVAITDRNKAWRETTVREWLQAKEAA